MRVALAVLLLATIASGCNCDDLDSGGTRKYFNGDVWEQTVREFGQPDSMRVSIDDDDKVTREWYYSGKFVVSDNLMFHRRWESN